MLSEKPWKADAILRLFLSVLVCIFLGALVFSVVRFFTGPREANPVLFFGAALGAFALLGFALYLLRRSWDLDTFTRRFIVLLICIYAGLSLSWWALHLLGGAAAAQPTAWKALIGALSFQGLALLLVGRFLREHQVGWTEAFGFRIGWKHAALVGALAAFAVLPPGLVLQWVSVKAMTSFGVDPAEQTAVQVLRGTETWLDRLLLGFAAIVLAPVAEEILFRGILYPAVKQAGYPRLALWGTAILFAAVHMNIMIFLPLTFLALVLTWLYERTGNLLAAIVAHSGFNGINFLMFTLHKLQTESG